LSGADSGEVAVGSSYQATGSEEVFFGQNDPIYLQSVIINSANGGKGEGCPVEEYSVALLCQ
jgi:hypothetical protein